MRHASIVISLASLAALLILPVYAGATERYSVVHVPASYDAKKPAPLLLVLHGFSLDADTIEEFSGLSELSEKEGFIAVYPDGSPDSLGKKGWNAGPFFESMFGKADDEGFILSLLKETGKKYSVDPKRIYVVGYSNGGFMAHTLAQRHPGLFAGIGAVAASASGSLKKLTAPVSVIHIHGLADPVVPFKGSDSFQSLHSVIARFRELNGCSGHPSIIRAGSVEGEIWTGKKGDVAVYVIKGLGHEWPVNEMNTGEVLWNFLKNHSLK